MTHKHLNDIVSHEEITLAVSEAKDWGFHDQLDLLFQMYQECKEDPIILGEIEEDICSQLKLMVDMGLSSTCIKVYETCYKGIRDVMRDNYGNSM